MIKTILCFGFIAHLKSLFGSNTYKEWFAFSSTMNFALMRNENKSSEITDISVSRILILHLKKSYIFYKLVAVEKYC